MQAHGLLWIEYRTADGIRLRLEVSRELAEALDAADPQLKEITFTDLAGKLRHKDERRGLDPDTLDARSAQLRVKLRQVPTGNAWVGPRFRFTLLLGEGRSTWHGGPCLDDRGRCGLCHDMWLPLYVYCLACNRSGRDREIPTAGETARRRAPRSGRLKGGLAGKR